MAILKYRAFLESNMHHISNKLPERFLPPTNRPDESVFLGISLSPSRLLPERPGWTHWEAGLCSRLVLWMLLEHLLLCPQTEEYLLAFSSGAYFFPLKSEFNVLGLWHFGKCFLNTQGCQSGRRIVSPAFCHEFPHLP